MKAYEHFNDPEWDGEPLPPETPGDKEPKPPRVDDYPAHEPGVGDPVGEPKETAPVPTIVVKLGDGRERAIHHVSATTYWWEGRMITPQEFMQQLFGDLGTLVASEDALREVWSDPERREGLQQRLTDMGYDAERLDDIRRLIDAPNSDVFDVLAYVRFTLAPMARAERADTARSSGLPGYEPQMREFLDYVLGAYETHGVGELATGKLADLLRIRYGGTNDAKRVSVRSRKFATLSLEYSGICIDSNMGNKNASGCRRFCCRTFSRSDQAFHSPSAARPLARARSKTISCALPMLPVGSLAQIASAADCMARP